MDMSTIIPKNLIFLAQNCPFPLYVVGGACRDFLLGFGNECQDWDVCAPTDDATFCQVARSCGFVIDGVYKNTGTVKFHKDKDEFEFSCFRNDEYIRGLHSPSKIYFTDDITLDAKRRDFRCNAIYYDLNAQKFVDPLGGIDDVKNGIIETVRQPEKVFGEDGLRLMRLARQSAETGLVPTPACILGAKLNANLIADVSAERIFAELCAILIADQKHGVKDGHYRGLKILKDTGVLKIILPELALGDGMEQNPVYHAHDVLEHCLQCAKFAHPSIRFSALLHDVGKPQVKLKNGNYHAHDVVGAELSKDICARLKVPKKLAKETEELIRLHMYDLNADASENKVRRFIVKHFDLLDKLLLIKQADYSAYKGDLDKSATLKRWDGILKNMKKEGVPFTLKQLNLRGDDLVCAGIKKELVGKILVELLLECSTDATLNVREKLVKRALAIEKQWQNRY